MRQVTVAAVQFECSDSSDLNLDKAEKLVRDAASKGAQVILLSELFKTKYFCQERQYEYYSLAASVDSEEAIVRFQNIARELKVVLPISFYERDGSVLYNSIAIIDATGVVLGVYRKTHIPDDHFYQEKFYFTPGNTGFKVWDTAYCRLGVGICWDQWFPEAARIMALEGADILLYPTAIGAEPILDSDSMEHWRRCMQGHSAANLIPVIASNRIGTENVTPCVDNAMQSSELCFYGSSFITDGTGAIVESASRDTEEILIHSFDLDELFEYRMSWGVFRDRRPDCYNRITK